jgi:branched-chain amino acid transport system substrate-binding protein
MKIIWIGIGIIIFIALAIVLVVTQTKREPEEIKIGAILPLSGEGAKYGMATKRGIDLALEEINRNGGIHQRKIIIIYEDDRGEPKSGVSCINKLIQIDKVPCILGPIYSSVALAVAPIAEREKTVLLSPAASTPALTRAGDYIFRNVLSDLYEASALAKFVYTHLGFRRVSILYINNDFGLGHKESFASKFETLGGRIIATESFEQDATDFRTQLTKLGKANPEAIFLVGYREMGRVLRQSSELGTNLRFLSISMFEDPEILEIAGGAAEGVYYSLQTFDPQSAEEIIRKFVLNFKSVYNQEPDIFAGLGYDAMNLLAIALEKGGSDPEKIKNTLYTIKDFPGVTGKTTFDQNGDVQKTVSIKKVENGHFIWVERNYK